MPLVAALIVALDQITKSWVVAALDRDEVVDLVWTLRLNLVFNSGTAFSMGRSIGPLLGVLAVLVVLVLISVGRIFRSPATAVALGAVLGGAVGNLIDRAVRSGGPQGRSFLGGHVVDFIDFQWWPVFNVADMAIVCGAIVLAWCTSRTPTDPSIASFVTGDRVTDDPTDRDESTS